MNAFLPLFAQAQVSGSAADKAADILAAARAMVPHLNRSRALDRKLVAGVMTMSFGGSDADGAWCWRDAYDAMEAAVVLQLRRLAPQISRLEDAPADVATMALEFVRDAAAASYTTATGEVWSPWKGNVRASRTTAA